MDTRAKARWRNNDGRRISKQLMKEFALEFLNITNLIALRSYIESSFEKYAVRVENTSSGICAIFTIPTANFWKTGTEIIREISSCNYCNLQSWIKTPANNREMTKSAVNFDRLTGFHFPNYSSVQLEPIWNQNFTFLIKPSFVRLIQGSYSFLFRPIDIDGPIFVNETEASYQIFFCFRNPPSLYYDGNATDFNFSGRSFNIFIESSKAISSDISWKIRKLLTNFSLEVYNVHHLNISVVEETDYMQHTGSFAKKYLLEVWKSKYASILPPRLPMTFINRLMTHTDEELHSVLSQTVPKRFEPLQIAPTRIVAPSKIILENSVMLGRVKITPSRLIFMPMRPTIKNRVYRYFPNPENFLIVSFTDEHDSNPWRSQFICDYFLRTLHRGFEIGGKRFTFLGCSNSQLREGRCWFSCLDRQMVYKKIGEFPDTMGAGRKLTRLALAFASSIETVPVNIEYLRNVSEDTMSKNGDVIFSDGIGRASQGFFNQIKRSMKLEDPSICALQIRVGGIKGVITMFDESSQDVTFRKSMKKFESNHNMLEVLHYNRSVPLYLNRHVILLLSSFGIPDEVFLELQSNDLMTSMNALTDDKESLRFVKSRSKVFDWEELPKTQIVQEPFFRQILISNTIDFVGEIVEHAHILVEKGRVLMGVLDETNTLQYGEVYAHIFEEGIGRALDGRVLVFRNPSVLPSDIRVLNARSNVSPRLRSLYKNCLVFPSKGPDSHANECAGGDLDGDLYYVVWDRKLVPDIEIPGEKIIKADTTNPRNINQSNSDYEMMRFYCNFVWKNKLGTIANAHLAIADKFGMRAPQTINLARYVSAETDAPVKGLTVGHIENNLLPTEYPDYMMKFDKPMYRSTTVLGKMFFEAYSILDIFEGHRIQETPNNTEIVQMRIHDSIDQYYNLYRTEIDQLIQQFDLQSEADLFSGTAIWRKGYTSAFKMKTTLREQVLDTMKMFWMKWTKHFEDLNTDSLHNQELTEQWYHKPKSCSNPAHSFSIIAMPRMRFQKIERRTLPDLVQTSTSDWINFNKQIWVAEWRNRSHIRQKLQNLLAHNENSNFNIHYFGISALCLNDDNSDVELFVSDELFKHLVNTPSLNVEYQNSVTIIIKLDGINNSVKITTNVNDALKSYKLASIFDEYPSIWKALRVIVSWYQVNNCDKSKETGIPLSILSLCELFIHKSKFKNRSILNETDRKPYSLDRLNQWMDPQRDDPNVGKLIVDFFKYLSDRNNEKEVLSNRGEIPKYFIDHLVKKADSAIYILALKDGNVTKLVGAQEVSKKFRRLLSLKNATYSSSEIPISNVVDSKPLLLTSLFDAKHHQIKKGEESKSLVYPSSPFPEWKQSLGRARQIALSHRYYEIPFCNEDCVLIWFAWNNQDWQIKCSPNGFIEEIRSANNLIIPSPDRFYLDSICRKFNRRSVLQKDFHQNIDNGKRMTHPLTPELFRCDWIITSIRRIILKYKFKNNENDILTVNEVNDANIPIFNCGFSWYPRRFEFCPLLNDRGNDKQNNKLIRSLKYKLYGFNKDCMY